jgi:hypothetical protein
MSAGLKRGVERRAGVDSSLGDVELVDGNPLALNCAFGCVLASQEDHVPVQANPFLPSAVPRKPLLLAARSHGSAALTVMTGKRRAIKQPGRFMR